ncbi:hypothetical protein [Undibacterium sp.]|uniref:hypothetical protein n=1 Tax=Undibacterium sp. TaxID=1914977 RepID=UPI003752EC61
MRNSALAYRATLAEACSWLQAETGTPWNLSSLIAHGLIPYVWLDYNDQYPELFGDANGGFAAPIFFQGDTHRLAAGSEDVLITMTKDADKIAIQLPPPGLRAPLADLRFLRKDLNALVAQINKAAQADKDQKPTISESNNGISKEQVLLAFAGLVKINLEVALMSGDAIFGDDGARIKSSAKSAKNKWRWNPVTLALGLNDNYRVPMSRLKRAFLEHEFLTPWMAQWNDTLALLGE